MPRHSSIVVFCGAFQEVAIGRTRLRQFRGNTRCFVLVVLMAIAQALPVLADGPESGDLRDEGGEPAVATEVNSAVGNAATPESPRSIVTAWLRVRPSRHLLNDGEREQEFERSVEMLLMLVRSAVVVAPLQDDPVLKEWATVHNVHSPLMLFQHLHAARKGNTGVVTISLIDPSPTHAAAVVNQIAAAVVRYMQELRTGELRDSLKIIDDEIDLLTRNFEYLQLGQAQLWQEDQEKKQRQLVERFAQLCSECDRLEEGLRSRELGFEGHQDQPELAREIEKLRLDLEAARRMQEAVSCQLVEIENLPAFSRDTQAEPLALHWAACRDELKWAIVRQYELQRLLREPAQVQILLKADPALAGQLSSDHSSIPSGR